MDVFKILSRATGFSKGAKPSPAAPTPSSGESANPQIFRTPDMDDAVGGAVPGVLGKRKRRINRDVSTSLPPEIDFFANGIQKSAKKQATSFTQAANDGKDKEFAGPGAPAGEKEIGSAADMEERKRILRAHKIKITLLQSNAIVQTPDDGSKKKKKRKSKDLESELGSEAMRKPQLVFPRPLTSFSDLGSRFDLHQNLAENLRDQGYTVPTEVQLAALPLLLSEGDPILGSTDQRPDILSIAPTGSGKTLAFLIPIFDALVKNRQMARKGIKSGSAASLPESLGPSAVIVAPTKELANQIVNEGRKLALKTGIKVTLVRKGMSVGTEETTSSEEDTGESGEEESDGDDMTTHFQSRTSVKSDILVSTPLTMLNALKGADGQIHKLRSVQHFVLDEADVLLDPLFKDQTIAIWQACANPDLRSTLWSATMPSSIETLARDMLAESRPAASTLRLVVGIKDTSLPTITHKLTYAATETGKLLALRQLFHPTATNVDAQGGKALRPPFLVFTQTIERAIALHAELKFDIPPEAGGSTRIAVLHSGLSEGARGKVMAAFRKGEVWVIITTDLLARGVDFRGLNGVVNYDVPTSAAAYVHRVGRTGRAGREGGIAFTLYTKEDIPYIKAIANVIAASEKLRQGSAKGKPEGSGEGIQQWLLDALPTPSKREKQELKKKGVEARRKGVKGEKISTKSKYDRKNEVRKKQARQAVVRRQDDGDGEASDFEGFDQ